MKLSVKLGLVEQLVMLEYLQYMTSVVFQLHLKNKSSLIIINEKYNHVLQNDA